MYYSLVDDFLFSLPVPVSISYMWGFGSMLGLCLVFQLVSGLFLSFFYSCGTMESFSSVVSIMMDVQFGWAVRYMHSAGASLLMMFVYIHVLRGLWYGSFKLVSVWVVGVVMLVLMSLVSFLGYVLPWGQMSYWAATVITSMVTALPYVGGMLSWWLWGSFSVGGATLVRFFSFHYILSLVVVGFVVVHLVNLHEVGSSNPVGCGSKLDKLSFHPLYSYKDVLGLMLVIWAYWFMVMGSPFMVMDSVNFEECNSMVTPVHIKPEWYFLYAYCILRSVSSKIGGVSMMILGMLILALPSVSFRYNLSNVSSIWMVGMVVYMTMWSFMGLTLLGGCLVEYPYEILGKFMMWIYFFSIVLLSLVMYFESSSMKMEIKCDY